MKTNKRKKIGIDARFYGPVGKGLGRYTKEVLDRVVKIDRDNDYVVFLSQGNYDNYDASASNIRKVLVGARWYSLAEQLQFPLLIMREKVDMMHFPHFNVPLFCPVKFIVTIHDLILTKHPTQRASTLSPILYRVKNLAYKIIIKQAVRRSRKIITVSEFTKDDIVEQFSVKKGKIVVTYEGVTALKSQDRNNDNKEKLGYNNIRPFLLYVGNAYPHKNLEGLVRVFKKIHTTDPELSLVLIGKEDYFFKRVKALADSFPEVNDKIIFPGYVEDSNLVWYFQNAVAYIFPSLYEGFGLPPLEAMSYGCPVLSSNKSSMPEILGDAAAYFNPENDDEIIAVVKKIREDKNLCNNLIKKGYKQIQRYSWQKCSEDTCDIFRKELAS